MSVSHIASFSARVGSVAVTPAGFGVPLLAGYHNNFGEDVKAYTGDSSDILQSLIDDGFTSGDAIHEMARVLLSQETAPRTIKVGRLDDAWAQAVVITPLELSDNTTYTLDFEINGLTGQAVYQGTTGFNANTITAALAGTINALSIPITATANTGTLELDADNAGDVFRLTVTVNGRVGDPLKADLIDNTPAPAGLAARLTELNTADSDWYFLLLDINSDAIANVAGDFVASLDKVYVAGLSDSDATESGTSTDFMSDMVGDSNDRAAAFWDGKYNGYAQCAMVGKLAPRTPGGITWSNQILRQVTTPTISSSLYSALDTKKYTVYRPVSSTLSATRGGHVGGTFLKLDVTRGLDWLKARSSEAIANLLLSADKVPFTAEGIEAVRGVLQDVVDRAVANGLLSAGDPDSETNPPPRVVVPNIDDVSASDKAARQLTGVKITGVLAGAIETVVSGEIVVEF